MCRFTFPACARYKRSTAWLVKSRGDGQTFKIDFAEGQESHAGDIVAEIDPRPYAAALAQAKAAKLKDEAQLKNAQLDRSGLAPSA